MPDELSPAPSGRAKCRGCGRPIEKGALRFGECAKNPFAEGETLFWFHVPCAACMRSEKLLALLPGLETRLEDEPWIRKVAESGVRHHRLQRVAFAERASSGRARCRHCREVIEKGAFRIALQMFEDGRMNPIGFIHVPCAGGYFGTTDVLDRLLRLTPSLAEKDVGELATLLLQAPATPAPDALAKTRGDGAESAGDGAAKSGNGQA